MPMDLIHKFLNLIAPPFTFFSLIFLVPSFQLYKFVRSLLSLIVSENVSGKVVLITGASSGIGEYLAYEYARRGANLALCARRENSLKEVEERARELGAPDVLAVLADVSDMDDCRRFVEETVSHFGRLDHVVNNAGIYQMSLLEDIQDVTNLRPVMDINFWGSVYTTRFAAPHLKRNSGGGKIIAISSANSWIPQPRHSIYNASKAAMYSFFETMRIELSPEIHVTLVTPGFIESEITQGKFLEKDGRLTLDQDMRDVSISGPVGRVDKCAKAIVNSACRGQRYLTEPSWFRVTYVWKVLCPELVEFVFKLMLFSKPGTTDKEAPSKKILDVTGAKNVLYPESIQTSELKAD